MRNQCYADQFLISIFWAPIGGEKGVAATPVHKGLGPQNPTNMLFPKLLTLDPLKSS